MRTTLLLALLAAPSAFADEPRDPFAAFPDDVIECFGATPLQKAALDSLTVRGIVAHTAAPRALVKLPDGTAVLVRVGDGIGPHLGVVAAIKPEGIVVVERFRDAFGYATPVRTLLAVR